jgi:hypothetical protein
LVTRQQRADWQRRAEQARTLCDDPAIPLWKKAHLVGSAYQDVQLDGLKSRNRRRLFADLAGLNQILTRYPIETFDDYQLIAEEDLRTIVATFRGFARFKIRTRGRGSTPSTAPQSLVLVTRTEFRGGPDLLLPYYFAEVEFRHPKDEVRDRQDPWQLIPIRPAARSG